MSTDQQIPLQLAEEPLETTDWADGPPPTEGWWIASRSGQSNKPRRFYDRQTGWSMPAYPGSPDSSAAAMRRTPAERPEEIRWKGLTSPHPDGYSYELTPIK